MTTDLRAERVPDRTAVPAPRPRAGSGARLAAAFAMFRNRKSITGLAILGFFVLVALLADVLAPYSPTKVDNTARFQPCLLYTSPSPRDRQKSRMPSSA